MSESMQFWSTELGREVLSRESAVLAGLVRHLHGETVVWVGPELSSTVPLDRCMTRNPTVMLPPEALSPCADSAGYRSLLCGDLDELPFRSNSVDGVILHHALESVTDPRVALREVTRVLSPGGRVVVCGVNPFSLLGLRHLVGQVARVYRQDAFAERRLVNPMRLFDWFTLLGLDLDHAPVYFGYSLPFAAGTPVLDKPDESEGHGAATSRAEADAALDAQTVQRDGQDREPLRRPTSPRSFPFAGLLAVTAVKQAISLRGKWRKQREPARAAPVAYPRIASWQRDIH